MLRALILGSLVLGCLAGCKKDVDESLYVGQGVGVDARLTSDAYTWACTNFEGSDDWAGVYGFDISLEFVPDAVPSRALPPVGSCSYGLAMFAADSLVSGQAIPDAAEEPIWTTLDREGSLRQTLDGLYTDEVFDGVLSCESVDDVVSGGVELSDAGVVNGVIGPVAGEVYTVEATGGYDVGIPFGTEVELEWEVEGWQESFVHVRRSRDEVAYETVTCNTTGMSEFEIDDAVWSLLDESLTVDRNFLYVGFQNVSTLETLYGQKMDLETRALHAVGIDDF